MQNSPLGGLLKKTGLILIFGTMILAFLWSLTLVGAASIDEVQWKIDILLAYPWAPMAFGALLFALGTRLEENAEFNVVDEAPLPAPERQSEDIRLPESLDNLLKEARSRKAAKRAAKEAALESAKSAAAQAPLAAASAPNAGVAFEPCSKPAPFYETLLGLEEPCPVNASGSEIEEIEEEEPADETLLIELSASSLSLETQLDRYCHESKRIKARSRRLALASTTFLANPPEPMFRLIRSSEQVKVTAPYEAAAPRANALGDAAKPAGHSPAKGGHGDQRPAAGQKTADGGPSTVVAFKPKTNGAPAQSAPTASANTGVAAGRAMAAPYVRAPRGPIAMAAARAFDDEPAVQFKARPVETQQADQDQERALKAMQKLAELKQEAAAAPKLLTHVKAAKAEQQAAERLAELRDRAAHTAAKASKTAKKAKSAANNVRTQQLERFAELAQAGKSASEAFAAVFDTKKLSNAQIGQRARRLIESDEVKALLQKTA